MECIFGATDGYKYCKYHKCYRRGCENTTAIQKNIYCIEHNCEYEQCSAFKKNDSKFCTLHSPENVLAYKTFLESGYSDVLVSDIKNEICRYVI
jgi:hypothetical protein